MTSDEMKKIISDIAERASARTLEVLSSLSGEPDKVLTKEAEQLLQLHNVSDESKLQEVRGSLHALPKAAQVLYLTSYFGAKSASMKDDVAQERAWNRVKQEYKKVVDAWVSYGGANVESTDTKHTVYHKNLVDPMDLPSRDMAVSAAISLMQSAKELPSIHYDIDANKFTVNGSEIESTEDRDAAIVATEKVSSEIEKLSHDKNFAAELGDAVIAFVRTTKEKERMKVTADSKQVLPGKPDSDLVSGVGNVTDKASAPKGGFPASVPSSRVVTEKPALKSIPDVKTDKHSLVQQHDKDYASLESMALEGEKKLQKAKGYMEEKPETIYAKAGLILAAAHKLGADKALEVLNEAAKTVESPAVVVPVTEVPAVEAATK